MNTCPEALSTYILSQPGLTVRIAKVLHLPYDSFRMGVNRYRRMVPWRIEQIRAVLELGLVQNNGGNGGNGRH